MRFRYAVYIYLIGQPAIVRYRNVRKDALSFGRQRFKDHGVYKVKVWDLEISRPVPNVETHKALILHLV